jgi:hypothetical protein
MMKSIFRFSFLQKLASSPTSSPSKLTASTNSPSNREGESVEVQGQDLKVIVQEDVIQLAKKEDGDEETTTIASEEDVEDAEVQEEGGEYDSEPQVLGKPTPPPDLLEDSSLVEALDFETLEEEVDRMKVSGKRTFYDRFSSYGQEYKRGDACLVKGSNNQSFVGIIVAIWLIDQDETTLTPSSSSTSLLAASLLPTPSASASASASHRSPSSSSVSLSSSTPNGKPRKFVTISNDKKEDDSLRRSKRLRLDPEVKRSFSDLSPRTPSHFSSRQLTKREKIQNRRKHVFFLVRWFFEPQDTYLSKNAATFLDYGYIHPQELFLGMTATDYQTPEVLEGKAIVKYLASDLTDHQVSGLFLSPIPVLLSPPECCSSPCSG